MATSTTAYLLKCVLEDQGSLTHIRRLANSAADGQVQAFATVNGRVILGVLKRMAKETGDAHLLGLLHRYGRWEAQYRARSSWYRDRSC
ncbi:hypothetical protein [Streptomyces europaeiscabiei]|uniref:hypothetical protein n=1 Tax=Streptomyces europaeiscabiei TaxID=146819 RepID=UPI0038F73A16